MSAETITHLNRNTLIGYTEKRGNAWHYRASEQGAEPNHYPGAIPVGDLQRRLFHWKPLEAEITATVLTDTGVLTVTDPTRKAIVRPDTGTVLGVHARGYAIHDYIESLVTNVENILDADLAVGSAGLLKGGAVGWVQVEMADTLEVKGVEFRPFLTAVTSLDGSIATKYLTGAQVVVCDNTLSVAQGTADTVFKIKHTSRSIGRLSDARQALGIVHRVEAAFQAQVETLVAQTVTDAKFREWAAAYTFPGKDATPRSVRAAERWAGELWAMWSADERVSPWRGNAFGVVQAANTHLHHAGVVRNAPRSERNVERFITGFLAAEENKVLAALAAVN